MRLYTHTHTHTVNFKGGEKELLKNGRGAENFSGSNFDVQNFNNCGQNVDTSSCNAKGITLIALIITIVIMLILAGITLNLTLGENGIFTKARQAKEDYERGALQEEAAIEKIEDEILWNGRYNEPKLGKGMTAVYWVDSNDHGSLNSPSLISAGTQWHNYIDSTKPENAGKTQMWANARTEDGSYWVWIPRYEYRINKDNQTIEINFIPTTQTTATDDADAGGNNWIIHPAFRDGSENGLNNGYANGEWDKELAGIWVAKYEISKEESTNSGSTWAYDSNNVTGNDLITNSGETRYRAVSKPDQLSWRNLQIGTMFINSKNMDEYQLDSSSLDSHLMKNSEWGAVAYLTYSKFGANCDAAGKNSVSNDNNNEANHQETEIAMNDSGYTTATVSSNLVGVPSLGNNPSTDNVYGVYDLSGGAYEYTAAFNTSTGDNKKYANTDGTFDSVNPSNFAYYKDGTTNNGNGSSKYATKYDNSSNIPLETNFNNYKVGDATGEVYINNNRVWFSDYSSCAHSGRPYFLRGGGYKNVSGAAGVFCLDNDYGGAYGYSGFRAVLAF